MPDSGICGISLSGNMYASAFSMSTKYNVYKIAVNSGEQVFRMYEKYDPKIIIYMFCERSSPWMMELDWKNKIPCKHVVLDADATQKSVNNFHSSKFYNFDSYISIDPSLDIEFCTNVYKVSHLRPDVIAPEYIDTGIVKIGFHGSATLNKGILELTDYVQQNFDDAELRFHCPLDYVHGGNSNKILLDNIDMVKNKIYKPGIKFFITTDIVSDQELINRISQNTVNCYFNRNDPYSLTSSSVHAALSARRPIAIRKSKPTIGYWNVNPSICVEENSITNIIKNGFEPLEFLYEKHSPTNICKEFESIVSRILNPSGFYFSI